MKELALVLWHFCLGMYWQRTIYVANMCFVSEMLQYTQKRVSGIEELEKRWILNAHLILVDWLPLDTVWEFGN